MNTIISTNRNVQNFNGKLNLKRLVVTQLMINMEPKQVLQEKLRVDTILMTSMEQRPVLIEQIHQV